MSTVCCLKCKKVINLKNENNSRTKKVKVVTIPCPSCMSILIVNNNLDGTHELDIDKFEIANKDIDGLKMHPYLLFLTHNSFGGMNKIDCVFYNTFPTKETAVEFAQFHKQNFFEIFDVRVFNGNYFAVFLGEDINGDITAKIYDCMDDFEILKESYIADEQIRLWYNNTMLYIFNKSTGEILDENFNLIEQTLKWNY